MSTIEIKTITPADNDYPRALKLHLHDRCPTFSYVGNLSLLDRPLLAVAGSRNIDSKGRSFTINFVKNAIADGYGIVSGGAVGVDHFARYAAINNGGILVEYVPDTLRARANDRNNAKLIADGRLLLLTDVDIDAAFTGKAALRRNKYIYASAVAGLVVRCDYEKGGSWSGGLWAHRNGICPVYTWDNPQYEGNQGLINNGVIGIDENFRLKVIN